MTKKIAPPKITGGGGDVFEDKVVAYLMACLLNELPPLDPNLGVLVALDFQTKASGWLLDDLLMTLSSSAGESHASFSIKSYPQFTRKSAPTDFVVGTWEQYLHVDTTKFEKERDILGLIAPPHGTAVKREIDGLLHKARSQRPVDFVERIEQPGFLSKPGIELFQSFGCPPGLANPGSSMAAETASLLARLRLLEFDFESNSSSSLGAAVQTCRSALLSEALDEAQNLWHTLVAFAAELRPHAGHVDLFRLLAELRGKFALKAYPSHRRDWDKLKTHTHRTLSAIPDKIGHTVSINRAKELEDLETTFTRSNVVVVVGPSGCGKTVIAKSWLEGTASGGTALWWNAKSFDVSDYPSFESKYGLSFQLGEILPAVVSEQSRVVIDGIDRVFSDAAFANISILLRILETANSPWRVIITCQPEEWERVQSELDRVNFSTERWATATVEEPKLDDLAPVWDAFPRLRRLTVEPQLQTLLLKPKVLDLLATKARTGDEVSTQNWVGESDLISWFWNSEVANGPTAIVRSNFLKRLGEKQADELDVVTPVDDFTSLEQGVVDDLIHDRICTLNHEQLSFGHDLYGDWARQRTLLGKGKQLVEYLKPRLGSPLWNRAVRLYGLHLLESNSDITQWKTAIESVTTSDAGNLLLDLLLESAIFATNPLPIYEKLWPELVADQGRLLNRLLGRFVQVATVPNPMMLALAKQIDSGSDTSYAVMNRVPIWPYWLPMIRVLHQHSEEVLKIALFRVAEIVDIWLRQVGEDWPLRKEAAELGVSAAENILEFKSEPYHLVKDDIDKKVFAAGLAGARELPERVSRFALTACARIAEPPPPLADPDPETLRRSLILGLRRRRTTVKHWPDGPKGRVDDAFQDVCLMSDALQPLILATPKTAQEVILALLIEESGDTDENDFALRDSLGTSLFFNWFPPLFFNGPFLYFLRNKPEEGVDLVVRFVNFVASVWVSRNKNRSKRFIIHGAGGNTEWFGNGDVYYWYRDQSNCPDTVVVALMALEKWLYEELDADHEVTSHLQRIISGSNNIAFAGLLSAIGRRQPSLFQGILSPLFGIADFLIWEKEYGTQRHDYLMIGWADKDPRMVRVAQEWHCLPHRQTSLYQMAQWAYLNVASMRAAIEGARSKWEKELEGLSTRQSYWKDELETLVASFKIENYKTEKQAGQEIWLFVPPVTIQKKIETTQKILKERYPIVTWPVVCRNMLNAQNPLPKENLDGFWNELQRVSSSSPIVSGPFGDEIRPEHAICGAIAVLLLLHRDWLHQNPERESWCIDRLTYVLLHPPEPGPLDRLRSDGTDREWSSFCAEVLPHLWAENPSSPVLRECIAKLAINSKFVAVAILFMSASRVRQLLGENFLQLRHLLHRWSGKLWSDRLERDEIQRAASLNNSPPDETSVIESADWRALVEDFVAGSLSPTVPSFRAILANLKPRVDLFSGEEDSAEFTDLDLSIIRAAYSWLPSLDSASDQEERAQWLSLWHELLDGTCERFTTPDDDDSHGTPYPWDRWVFDQVARLILDIRSNEQPQIYWEKILSLGPVGHYWIEDFFSSWFRRGLAAGASQSFVREWRRMAEWAFTFAQWNVENRRHLLDHQRVWWYLLGMSQDLVDGWDKGKQTLVDGMKDVYERWAASRLEESMNALQFAAFLRLPAADGIRLDGLLWLEKHTPRSDDEYWKEHNIQDIVSEVLDKCWTNHRAQLRATAEYFDAFKNLLSRLAAFQNPLALEIQRRITTIQ
jgi:hypothetical protein